MREGHDPEVGRSTGLGPGEKDRVFEVLAHPCRRFVLRYIDGPGDDATVTELAAAMAAAGIESKSPDASARGIDAVESTLYHVHVPKLTDAGLVRFDPNHRTVMLTQRAAAIRPVLEAAEEL